MDNDLEYEEYDSLEDGLFSLENNLLSREELNLSINNKVVINTRLKDIYISSYTIPKNLNISYLINLSNIDSKKWLKPKNLNNLYLLVSLICHFRIQEELGPDYFINISSKFLESVFTWRFAKPAIQLLEQLKVIEVNNKYSADKAKSFCKSYRLDADYRYSKLISINFEAAEPKNNKINNNIRIDNSVVSSPIEDYLLSCIKKLQLNKELLNLNDFTEKKYRRIKECINNFEAGLFNLRAGQSVNRIYSIVTQMPKELRECLTLNNNKLIELDIQTAQPVLLLSLYSVPNPEIEDFKKALNNDFYSLIDGSRKKNKDYFNFYCFGKRKIINSFGREMRLRFPILAKEIENIPGKELNIKLQNLEADLIINNICEQLKNLNIFVVTVHDSFLVESRNINIVKNLVIEVFNDKLNYFPTLKIK